MSLANQTANQKNTQNSASLLVVEDELFWVDLLRIEFESIRSSISITHASNGEEAVELIKKSQNVTTPHEGGRTSKYDAIIMDIQMPIMNGVTAVRIIRDLLYTGPIIVWSSYRNSNNELKQALDIPVSGFCVKECTMGNLVEHLRHLKVI